MRFTLRSIVENHIPSCSSLFSSTLPSFKSTLPLSFIMASFLFWDLFESGHVIKKIFLYEAVINLIWNTNVYYILHCSRFRCSSNCPGDYYVNNSIMFLKPSKTNFYYSTIRIIHSDIRIWLAYYWLKAETNMKRDGQLESLEMF